ncbi:ComEC/Rec2 family competence protein [Leptolyngbya sp. FACHB-541]|uniref:ComEC/Rec2 family competence protein n=1 Tax=Leptolyngbya sp. FACHB-541 TaxID=2692810 RepID=UPI0016821413|nr:ComEC/Rec2 family competence protein [Leptolyngbya sp. FACHB-541]MBD2000584.1 ComEC/Rec2 family competence protein [Leptolyngbya sp. FACHB-541]
MAAVNGAVLSLAYILGLLLTALPGQFGGIPLGAIALLLTGAIASFTLPRFWKTGPRSRLWLAAGLVGLLATFYFQLRLPDVKESDISNQISNFDPTAPAQLLTVQGKIDTPPQLTRKQKVRFWLNVTQVSEITSDETSANAGKPVTGKLYVTVPLLQGTGLTTGQVVAVTGTPYKPKPAENPGGFNFEQYLARQGGFAGLTGTQIDFPAGEGRSPWGWWLIRERIVQSQVRWLGVPEGPLLSAMVMGRNGVDLPYSVQDQFSRAGLAHALAASGFQVSLLVGVMLTLTQKLPNRARLIFGLGVLILYTGLTGMQPSVLRAAVMGTAALIALTTERKVRPLSSILLAAAILLLVNPLWIWDLGFQLSFLATLGLIVTVPPLTQRLDWLPPAIATLIVVPLAAYLWTLPLQLYAFGVVSPYSILLNVLATPLITLISIGGMISAVAALFWSTAGSALGAVLYYPLHALVTLAEFCNQLPGNSFATGTISVIQAIALYSLIVVVWAWRRGQKFWWIAFLLGLSLVAIPLWFRYTNLFQVTVLSTSGTPVLVVQERGSVGLINSGDEENVNFTVLPFLRKQGVNQINWAISTDPNPGEAGWDRILADLPIQNFYQSPETTASVPSATADTTLAGQTPPSLVTSQPKLPLPIDQAVSLGSVSAMLLNADPVALQLNIGEQQWLLLQNLEPSAEQQRLLTEKILTPAQVLWWSGEFLRPDLLSAIDNRVAIASAYSIDPDTALRLREQAIATYWTGHDGAIQWTPEKGFTPFLSPLENSPSAF